MPAASLSDVVAELAGCSADTAAGELLDRLVPPDDRQHGELPRPRPWSPSADRPTAVRTAIGLLDLTSLKATDTAASVAALCARARAPGGRAVDAPPTAAVCVTPDLVGVAVEHLAGSAVRAACVAGGFPSARTFRAVKEAEIDAALAAGAEEIDVVADRAALGAARHVDVIDEVRTARQLCDARPVPATLKVILEVDELADLTAVRRAAWTVLAAGADFVKTSTGTTPGGATPEVVGVLCGVVAAYEAATGEPRGVKAAGGVRTSSDALRLLQVAESVGGPGWLAPDRLRIGASGLLDDLVTDLQRARAGT